MKALVLVKHGTPDEALAVREWPDPVPGSGEVLVDVRAAGLNFADVLARIGLYPDAPKPPCVMGYEVAGLVESVGPGVEDFEPGARIVAATRFNGFAERAVAKASDVLALPETISFEQGAALPVVYGTAYWAAVLLANVREGETVLVHAAAGGVGIAATQILRDRGATVIGTASASKQDAIRGQGVAHAIDYRTQDFEQEVKRITGGEGVDVVLDALGEFKGSYACLRPGGRLVMYGASKLLTGDRRSVVNALRTLATMPRFNAVKLMNQNKSVMGINLLKLWDARGSLADVTAPLRDLVERGVARPVVAETFPFSRAADAHRFIQDRKNVGKVVLVPDGV
jgi:NADPH:quinone reductase-like Zn-dependent oxidoreductase